MDNRSEVSGDATAAKDIGTVDNGHDEVAEVSDTLEKSSGLLFDKCRARIGFNGAISS